MVGTLRSGIVLLLLLATSSLVAVGDDLSATAVEALEAVRGKDAERLAALAQALENDPWRVVDDLIAAGHAEVAKAYATAAGEPYSTPLGRYLTRVPQDDRTSRGALSRARGLMDEGKLEAALDALENVTPPAGTILSYRIPAMRAFLLVELERHGEAAVHDEVAMAAAASLGRDLTAERHAVHRAWNQVGWRVDPTVALKAAERLATLFHYPRWDLNTACGHLDLASACLGCYLPGRAQRHLRLARRMLVDALEDDAERKHWPAVRLKLAYLHARLCCAYDLSGESPRAFLAGEQAVGRFRSIEDPIGEAQALWILGDAHANAGTLPTALECYRSARALLADAGEQFAEPVFELRINEGGMLQAMGRLDEALPILTRAAEQVRSGAKGAVPAVTLMNLGEVQLKAGKPDLALATFRRALDTLESDCVHESWCRMLIGDALTLRGTTSDPERLAKADASYRAALELLPEPLEPTLRMYLLTGLGEVQLAQGRARKALVNARRCLELLEGMTGGMADGEAVSARGHEDRLRATSLAVASARATNEPRLVLEMLERSRAQAFLAALGGRRGVRRATLEPEARVRIEAADHQLLQAVRRYRREVAVGRRKRVRAARDSLDAARAAHHHTVTSVERDARLRESVVLQKPASLDDLHASLRPGEGAVLYGVLSRGSVALVAAEGRAWTVNLPAREEVEQACANLVAEDPTADRAKLEMALEHLGEMVLGPLNLPESIHHLIVSPDGGLAHLPWPWLTDRHFGRNVDVTLVPSATSLLVLSTERPRGRGRVALGNPDYGFLAEDAALRLYLSGRPLPPLPDSEAEAKAAAGPDGTVLLSSKATERALEAALAESGPLEVLHLACHGIVNRMRPEHSALALTPSAEDDGFLTALEVSALEIPADLVVLSACESGRDRSARGEGIQGLARAFLLAGARHLVVSMWKVDDEATRLFMERFYQEWNNEDVRVHTALRRARAAVDHPSDWAAWVVWGVPR